MVDQYCKECPECQRMVDIRQPKAPLIPLPLVGWPFKRITLDVAGPFPQSRAQHKFVLVIIDYTTRFPEVIPLHSVTANKIAEELLKWILWVGIPKEILTD